MLRFATMMTIGVFVAVGLAPLVSQESILWDSIIGSAFTGNQSYALLQKMCDEAGGRLAGSANNEKAMAMLKGELEKLGYEVRLEKFKIPGWVRGDDEVLLTSPTNRKLKAVALGYIDKHPAWEAPLVYAELGAEDNYQKLEVQGKAVLVSQSRTHGKGVFRSEAIEIAAKRGAKAILFINDKPGNQTLTSASNYHGTPTAIPAYSLTSAEGAWLERLIKRAVPASIRITTHSYCQEIETANIVAALPGQTNKKIVIGAHFDSWDVGQGAIDNGSGSAVLFEVARLLKNYSPQNSMGIEMVWFNAEELGLWGSKKYVEMHEMNEIAAMINMDMIGSPTGFNVMGFDEFKPFFQNLCQKLNGMDLKDGVTSMQWAGSDHIPFLLKGIPAFTPSSFLEEERVRHYHDMGDTFDKVSKKQLSEAAAVVTIIAKELANTQGLVFQRRNEKETIEMLKKSKLDLQLKRQREWPFAD